jgi:glycosyltransferase involved in cell wall biosynthesis
VHRVLHVLRAPVGGLFRHVRDLVPAQHELGLKVGMVCDSNAADGLTKERLAALEPHLDLGLHLIPMQRGVGLADAAAYRTVRDVALKCQADILHGHGAKGGAYARLASAALRKTGRDVASFYTPHGGSLNYPASTIKGKVYMALERRLERMTGGVVFESAWSERIYRQQVCEPACAVRVVPNGLLPSDFEEHVPAVDAVDIVFIGELRHAKGIDLLLESLAAVRLRHDVKAVIVGDGPDAAVLKEMAEALGLAGVVSFPGAMPARKAFSKARVLVIPSRWESFPYIVLEAAAAGIPMITTDVGGIPEIVHGTDTKLVRPDDVPSLVDAINAVLADPGEAVARAKRLRDAVQSRFTVERMARDIADLYDRVALPRAA